MLRRFSPFVEKLGMDEAFLDVTGAVERELSGLALGDGATAAASGAGSAPHQQHGSAATAASGAATSTTATAGSAPAAHHDHHQDNNDATPIPFTGHLYQGRASGQRPCGCGCRQRLAVGSRLAAAMRGALKAEVGYMYIYLLVYMDGRV